MRHAGKSKGNGGRVTVLTHCDKLEQSSPSDAQRLQTTLDATGENSSLTFAIHGCAQDHGEEDAALRHVPAMDVRVEVGAKPLAAHLEERMRVHLATQYPKAVAKLEKSLAETLRRLELVKEKSPLEVLFEMSARVQANHQAKRHGLMNDLRVTLDEMTRSIKDFRLRPLSPGVASLVQPRDSFDEPLEVGSLVYFKQTDAAQKTSADLFDDPLEVGSLVYFKQTDAAQKTSTASWRPSAGCTWLIPSSAPSRCSPSCGSSSPTWPRATRRCARRWRR